MRDFKAGDVLDCIDNFQDAGRFSSSEIVMELCSWSLQFFKRCDVGAAQVVDMDIVSKAGPVWSGVVGAKNDQLVALTSGGLNGERDEVGFRVVVLTDFSIRIRAGCIEVAEAGVRQSVGLGTVSEENFHILLGLAIGTEGLAGEVLVQWHLICVPKNSAGRTEYEGVHLRVSHRLQQVNGFGDVVVVVLEGIRRGFTDVGECREMHDDVDFLLFQNRLGERDVTHVAVVDG